MRVSPDHAPSAAIASPRLQHHHHLQPHLPSRPRHPRPRHPQKSKRPPHLRHPSSPPSRRPRPGPKHHPLQPILHSIPRFPLDAQSHPKQPHPRCSPVSPPPSPKTRQRHPTLLPPPPHYPPSAANPLHQPKSALSSQVSSTPRKKRPLRPRNPLNLNKPNLRLSLKPRRFRA